MGLLVFSIQSFANMSLEKRIEVLRVQVSEIIHSISDEYDPTKTYTAGQLVTHEGKLYRAKVDISTPEAWNPEHWEERDIEDEITRLTNEIASKYTKPEAGIPLTDLVQAIRDSLALADTSVQPEDINQVISVKRLGDYVYEATFDSIPEMQDVNGFFVPSGCTSFVRNGKLYRNLDWKYDNTASFHVICKGFEGMSFINGLNDGEIDRFKVGQLPYHIVDGKNDYGIMLSTHVLYNDWEFAGSGDKSNSIYTLPYYILSNLHRMTDISTVLSGYLANIQIPEELVNSEYLLQFLVTDGTTTYAILPPTSSAGTYQIVDITSNPKLTNFRWVNSATVIRTDLQDRPTGVERWNAIDADVSLEDLRFTLCYEAPNRLSEFIGIDGTTKDSTDEELTAIYTIAHSRYLTRTRNGSLWQTVHSVIYGEDGLESLFVQENWDRDYAKANVDLTAYRTAADQDILDNLKLNKNQAVANYGKVMRVGSDGNLVPDHEDFEVIKLESSIETLAEIKTRLDAINEADRTVVFDTSALNSSIFRCMISIVVENGVPTAYRLNDLVSGKKSLGSYDGTKTIGQILSEAVDDFVTIIVTCLTQDGVTVTGQTVTLREGTSHDAPVAATALYNGQPVSFIVHKDFIYFVEVSDTLAHHFNPTTATGVASTTTAITLTYSDLSNIKTAGDIQAALNVGTDLSDLVGEEITCTKGTRTLTWEVATYDATSTKKGVCLLLKDTLPDNMVFEPSQVLGYFENGLAAGSYTFKNGSTNYYFTLTQAIPEGGQLKATSSSFTTYESPEATNYIETGSVSTTEITGATSIGTTASGNLNHMDRVNYGSNNIEESALQWWLNTDAAAGTFRPIKNKFSRAYSYSVAGFLSGLDPAFLAVIHDEPWKCKTNNVYEAPEGIGVGHAKSTAYTMTAKFCLATQKEIFGSSEGADDGSTTFDLYVGATATDRIKRYNGSARNWWLRSPYVSYARNVRSVFTDGGLYGYNADRSHGVVPACWIRES